MRHAVGWACELIRRDLPPRHRHVVDTHERIMRHILDALRAMQAGTVREHGGQAAASAPTPGKRTYSMAPEARARAAERLRAMHADPAFKAKLRAGQERRRREQVDAEAKR